MVQWPLGADQAVGLPEQDLPPLWLVRSSPGTRKKMGRETGPIRLGTLIFPIFLWIDMGFRWFWVICVLLIYIYTYLRWFWVICTVMCVCVGFLWWYGPPIIQWILWYWSCWFILVFHVEMKGCVRLGLNTSDLRTLFFRAISCPISSASQHVQ